MIAPQCPKISVNLCTYNSEKYLKEAIESILQQSFNEFEFIIVDDGSTDSTKEILRKYQDSRIKLYFLEKNHGIAYARNYAVANSTGDYIAIMDHDDIANADRLKNQYQYAVEKEVDVCASFYMQMFNQTSEMKFSRQYISDSDLKALLTVYSPIADPTTMIKREILNQNPYSNEDQYAQDYGLWCRLAASSKKFGCCPKNLLIYRIHSNQISITQRETAINSFKKIQSRYIKNILNVDFVPHAMKFTSRIMMAFYYLIKLNKTIKRVSFGVNYQIYARFQYRGNGLLTPFTRLERVIFSLMATIVGRI